MRTEVRVVTPLVALEMLKRNANNRPCSPKHVRHLSNQMKTGEWFFDGQPLRLSENGTLLDGQHRLTAIVESGTSQEFLIVTGIHTDAFKVMDTGKIRNSADAFSIEGVKNYACVAASVKMVMTIDNKGSLTTHAKITNSQLLEWYNKNQSISDNVRYGYQLSVEFSKILPPTWIASMMFVFSRKNVVQSEDFMRMLCTGVGIEKLSPIYVLRKKLMEDKINTAKLPFQDKVSLMIKAWNLYRKGHECKFIRWDKNVEKFPVAI